MMAFSGDFLGQLLASVLAGFVIMGILLLYRSYPVAVLLKVLVALIVVSSPIWWIILQPMRQPMPEWALLLLASSPLLAAALFAFAQYRRGSIARSLPCSSNRRQVKVELADKQTITVTQLPVPAGETMVMDWPTFTEGIATIQQQFKDLKNKPQPDLIVGINGSGTMAAAYIDGNDQRRGDPFCAIKTGALARPGATRPLLPMRLPEIGEFPRLPRSDLAGPQECNFTILVVDGQFKSGRTARIIIDDLRTEYEKRLKTHFLNQPRPVTKVSVIIYFGVLVACGLCDDVTQYPNPTRMNQKGVEGPRGLFNKWGHRLYKGLGGRRVRLPDFLAYVSKGIARPPDGIT